LSDSYKTIKPFTYKLLTLNVKKCFNNYTALSKCSNFT